MHIFSSNASIFDDFGVRTLLMFYTSFFLNFVFTKVIFKTRKKSFRSSNIFYIKKL